MTQESYHVKVNREAREELLAFFKEQVAVGYRCFINTSADSTYGMIVLEDEVMDISYNRMEGWQYTNNYVPSTGNGSGCRCNDIKANNLSMETLRIHQAGCNIFMYRLRAQPYKSVEVALSSILKRSGWQYQEVEI
jgi:hypothetical protein